MKVYSKVVIDMGSGRVEEAVWEEYSGPVARCGGGGPGGGPGGDVSGVGNASFGNAEAGGSLGGFGMGFGDAAIGTAAGGGIGAGPGGTGGPGTGGIMDYNSSGGTGLATLGTPYPGMGMGMGMGMGQPTSTGFYYPTPQEVHNTISGLPYMSNQFDILGRMQSMPAFRAAVLPEVQGVMKTLGRTGLPSSSMADRAITETMGSLYNKWLWNALTGYQNIGVQMPNMMQQWYAPYNTMLSYVGS